MLVNLVEVRPEGEFETFKPTPQPGDNVLQGRLLIRISDAARLGDHFRLVFGGGGLLKASFRGQDLSLDPMLAPYRFHLEVDPKSIEIKQNCFAAKWEDLEALVAADRIAVSTEDVADAGHQFREAYEAAKKMEQAPATALRWSVQANPTYGFKLAIQALPATARALRKDARLASDTTKAVEVKSWTANSPMSEALWVGPVPVLFTPDAAATRASLSAHQERLTTGKTNTD